MTDQAPGVIAETRQVFAVLCRPTKRMEIFWDCDYERSLQRFRRGCREMASKNINPRDFILVTIPRFSDNYDGRIPMRELRPVVDGPYLSDVLREKRHYEKLREKRSSEASYGKNAHNRAGLLHPAA